MSTDLPEPTAGPAKGPVTALSRRTFIATTTTCDAQVIWQHDAELWQWGSLPAHLKCTFAAI
jgi:hypothetical protein